ncbi:hypothetical protein F5X96DRAFT_374964 [Biscogniauxia mediterranea]|nr:hypothetical protein F5X96DRAFT_374964 [Biscogniauxia mediterranea]
MLASTEAVAPPATSALYFEPLYDHPPPSKLSQPSFKKHKVLPHPKNDRLVSAAASTGQLSSRSLSIDTTKPSTPPSLRKGIQSVRALGPDLPPTPPAHSRTSSSSQSILPSSPTYVESPPRSVATNPVRSVPGTPPQQRSPPTPDVTPPQPERRSKSYRPVQADRHPSKGTADSRTESFKTAREDPDSSEEDDKTTPKPFLTSSRNSQNTVRRPADSRQKRVPQDVGLGLGLESDDSLTPRTKQEFFTFDGEWGSTSEVEQEWDDNLNRNVMVRKRRAPPIFNGRKSEEVIEDVTVAPTNATKALRSRPLHERLQTQPSPLPLEFTSRDKHSTAPSTSESSLSTDVRRSSAMSTKSTTSTTVVEAILVDTPPQRQKRLRHVRKQTALRDSSSEISAPSSVATSLGQVERVPRSRTLGRHDGARTESILSTGTINSVASRKARREVWKNGGIPVVVIPDRNASLVRSSGPPSLRSTTSHRSKRSNSLSAVPLSSRSREIEMPPITDRPVRRERAMSESDGLAPPFLPEQLTMDYPPIAPRRRSSLSAQTSRTTSRSRSRPGSRSASLTAESMRAHSGPVDPEAKKLPFQLIVERVHLVEDTNTYTNAHPDPKPLQPAPFIESHREVPPDHKPLVDHNGDPFFGKRLTAHNTPFSQASVETNGTHSIGDISEAMAVNIYPHQNKSVLMVHHMSKAVDPANALQIEGSAKTDGSVEMDMISRNPESTTGGPDGGPVTPPRPQFSLDVDSPLRNPRAPPEPPIIKLTPATPSGLTPTAEKEKMLGNYFEETQKRPSLVRRALSLRKNSGSTTSRSRGFFARTLSLSKTIRRDTAENPDLGKDRTAILQQYPTADDPPPDEDRLHPFWQPTSDDEEEEDEDEEVDEDDYVHDMPDEVEKVYRYPRFDKRPRRSLSERMKRTFAILPVEDDDHYNTNDQRGPERRTIKRTPSGNLRVMRQRDSFSSLQWSNSHSQDDEGRPSTAPDRPNHRVWGTEKRVDDRGRRIFPGWQEKLGQYRPQNIQRRLSEHRRQKRTDALRQKISGPREVRDGVGEVLDCQNYKGSSYQANSTSHLRTAEDDGYIYDPGFYRQDTQA